jgi:hypothetical protein
MNLVHVYIFSIASKSIMCVSLAKAQFASFGGASRRLVLSFRLSLLLPRDKFTHAVSPYRTGSRSYLALKVFCYSWWQLGAIDTILRYFAFF